MDANTFLHALRRRWLLAAVHGLVMAGGGAIALWFMFPASSSATALFKVAAKQESILIDSSRSNPQSFETLKKTQLALLKSDFVLTSAIRKPGIASLSVLAGEPDAVEWLQENLEVEFPARRRDSQHHARPATSRSPRPGDLGRCRRQGLRRRSSYARETTQARTRDLLARSLETSRTKSGDKWEEYIDIAREADRPQASVTDAETDLLLREISGC